MPENENNSSNSSNANNANNSSNANNSNNASNPNNANNSNVFLNTSNIIVEDGLIITNTQTVVIDNNVTTNTTFDTTDPDNHVPTIHENLNEEITYNYDDNVITESDNIVNEIREYAQKIKCEDFHGKGTIDDYTELFTAAAKIANETKQMQLDIDIDGFNEFGAAADELSALFTSFTQRLQNVNIINDVNFLKAVLESLKKIQNLSEVFGKFKQTILVTSDIKIPKTAHDTKNILEGVMGEVNCAMNYISHFVNPESNLENASLSDSDKNIISKAVTTIDNWKILCDQGVSIAMSNSTDMTYLKNTNSDLKQKTVILKNVSDKLRNKLIITKK